MGMSDGNYGVDDVLPSIREDGVRCYVVRLNEKVAVGCERLDDPQRTYAAMVVVLEDGLTARDAMGRKITPSVGAIIDAVNKELDAKLSRRGEVAKALWAAILDTTNSVWNPSAIFANRNIALKGFENESGAVESITRWLDAFGNVSICLDKSPLFPVRVYPNVVNLDDECDILIAIKEGYVLAVVDDNGPVVVTSIKGIVEWLRRLHYYSIASFIEDYGRKLKEVKHQKGGVP